MTKADEPETTGAGQRLDKWLWFARVIKSRTQAAGLVTDGKVRVNKQRVDKPSLTVKPGDVITVTVHHTVRVLKVAAVGVRRGPAVEAQTLYEDLTPAPLPPVPAAPGMALGGERTAGSGRPTKRERRQLTRLMDGDN